MSIRNTTTSYGSVAKFFHWSVSILVILMLICGPFMEDIANKAVRSQVFTVHKLIGLTILSLMLLRLLWTLSNSKPQLPPQTPAWERSAERVVHFMFYLLLISMPLSGWIMTTAAGKPPSLFGWFNIPLPGIPLDKPLAHFASSIHTMIAYTVAGFLVLHVGAALKHHLINKDDILRRMMPKRRK